jgi:polysaccharide biosynthesis/export protein
MSAITYRSLGARKETFLAQCKSSSRPVDNTVNLQINYQPMIRKISRCCFAVLFAAVLQAQTSDYQLLQENQELEPPESQVQPAIPDVPGDDCIDKNSPACLAMQAGRQKALSEIKSRNRSTRQPADRDPTDIPGRENVKPSRPNARVTEPPTQFQRFVQASTGRMLPIYGSWLFDRVPSTFAPEDRIPAPPDYAVGPGDEIDVRVWGQVDFSRRLIVDRSGGIFLPRAGRITAAGLKLPELEDAIKAALRRVYINFELSVTMGQLRSMQIFILGQARRPGTYTVSSFSTLVNALFASGGPSSRGSLRDVQVKRGGKVLTHFDLYDLLLRGDKTKDVPLLPGDVIFIPNAGPRVAVEGSVQSPAIYELTAQTSFDDLLNYAGGLSPTAGQRAILERIDKHSTLHAEDINLTREDVATMPRDGDIVRILSIVPRFERTVTLRGNVADPIRVAWYPGMKISALIPNKESLLTRGYWHVHNNLLHQDSQPERAGAGKDAGTDGANGDEKILPSSLYRENARSTSTDSSLAAATGKSDTLSIREFIKKNDLQPMAPDIDWNFASIERLDTNNLSTHLISFNLGKVVLDRDASADIELAPGDVVTIFSSADITMPRAQQTKYVRLEGEIKMAGVYSVSAGDTLRDLVARAGGLTQNAYLFGAQFTRESTRKEQQRRYSDYLDQLENDINQNAATLSGRIISAPQANSAQLTIANERALVARLRQAVATGRIVLDLQPRSAGIDALPEIQLENADRLFVPPVPSTVNVVGMVNNQAAFLYASDLRLGDYLQDAGGASRYADRRRAFVIRADGSVIAKETRSRLFSNSFDSLRMYPGDTLVMPTNVSKTTFLRSLIDWSQVVSNFGLGVAAVNVLR